MLTTTCKCGTQYDYNETEVGSIIQCACGSRVRLLDKRALSKKETGKTFMALGIGACAVVGATIGRSLFGVAAPALLINMLGGAADFLMWIAIKRTARALQEKRK